MNNATKIGARKWFSFIVAGLIGQLAWAIENMYLNVYAFHCTQDYKFIPIMTALSAIAATITTLFMGALSDRLGKRKAFISLGYIIWGLSIVLFATLDPNSSFSIVNGVANVAMLSGTLIVILDCVMTFFGSTANDAAFNAFVTDETDITNRGRVESVLSVLPMVAMIAIVVLAGILTSSDPDSNWDVFFIVFGALTTIAGIVCLFLLPKDKNSPNKEEPYFKNIFYGFRPTVIKQNPLLYILLIAFAIFSAAIQVFFPYLMVYIQNVLGIIDTNFTITLGVVLVVSCIITVIFGLFIDKIGKNKILIPAIVTGVIGAILFFFAKSMIMVIIAGIILISGYMVSLTVFNAKIRDYTPEKEVGLFQGIRMIFVVMIPMVTGPYIGEALSYINANSYVNEYGQTVVAPNAFIFLGTALVLALSIIPVVVFLKKEKSVKHE